MSRRLLPSTTGKLEDPVHERVRRNLDDRITELQNAFRTIPEGGGVGPAGPAGATGATGPAGPAPAGTGVVSVTGGVLNTPYTDTQLTTHVDVVTSALKGAAPASGGGTTNFLRADATWASPTTKPSTAGGWFGPGIHGSLNFDGVATVNGLVPVAGVYTLVEDLFPTDCIVASGVLIDVAGWQLLCSGTLSGSGRIHSDGAAGASGTATVGGAGGAGAITSHTVGGRAATGGAGRAPATLTAGANGTNGVNQHLGCANTGGAGGTGAGTVGGTGKGGGAGGNGTQAGGNGGTVALASGGGIHFYNIVNAYLGRAQSHANNVWLLGGSGGGGAPGATSSNKGGGGGGGMGGGVCLVAAYIYSGTVQISARGGAAGSGFRGVGSDNPGGGGGGGGGIACCVVGYELTTVQISAAGGAGGLGGIVGGSAGAAGGDGIAIVHRIALIS